LAAASPSHVRGSAIEFRSEMFERTREGSGHVGYGNTSVESGKIVECHGPVTDEAIMGANLFNREICRAPHARADRGPNCRH
jgi:hypothetical protein